MKSYHKFNEASRAEPILSDLASGMASLLDFGRRNSRHLRSGLRPCALCLERHIQVTAIPGPCAAIQAISCSGLTTERFQFWGFLARKENELKKELQEILSYPGVTICYESPRRLSSILEMIEAIDKDRALVVARELTKKFEEIVRGVPSFLLERWRDKTVKGEIVLLVSPASAKCAPDWSLWTPLEHVEWMEKTYSLSRKDALKLVAELRSVPKRSIYREMIGKESPQHEV